MAAGLVRQRPKAVLMVLITLIAFALWVRGGVGLLGFAAYLLLM
jgi:hypothetical protein